ncbi:hypothetical protein C6I21_09760 [Alkalicoccus urumqiensis]|uniref:Uncharacterized protein n=1 Tax=Alkalicoccus urumqiensis TaxID=1548213 RepID=A0A2P6MGL6_ALKUR|nr:hypothetical protein C6I21_09760 [Alkalicoccus urumqiensis]
MAFQSFVKLTICFYMVELLRYSAEACVGLSSSRALFARLQRMSGAGLWFEAQGSDLLACGAAVRSHASSIEALSSSSAHSLEVPSPLPKKAKSSFRRQGLQDWSLVTRALPLFGRLRLIPPASLPNAPKRSKIELKYQ